MRIKEEPIDPDDSEESLSKTTNVICFTQSTTNISSGKLDSTHDINSIETRLYEEIPTTGNLIIPSVSMPTQIHVVGSNVQSSSLPACETWPGRYDFAVSFNHQQKSTKGVAWTYSRIKDKLYVGKGAACPINFSTNTVLPKEAFIRVMALYTSPEQVTEIVQRCINHSMDEMKNGCVEARHLIRCESTTATYHEGSSGRHSVVVPFENPPAGQLYSTYIFKFACFGSCAGGPNRRPLMLVFTLEIGNQVLGRKKLDVKICACPGRDRKSEESQCTAQSEVTDHPVANPCKRKHPADYVPLSDVMSFTKSVFVPAAKKEKVDPNKDGKYTLTINDKDTYEFVRQMMRFYEMCKTGRVLQPAVMKQLMQKEANESD